MKKLLYFFSLLVLISSCKSVEKLVDKGQYDEAIFLAADRLSGKKHKKTKHVKALERAFEKINESDLRIIASLKAKDNPYYWKDVVSIIEKIERRQNRIESFLPLISKDGYQAKFKFVRTADIKNKALDGAAGYHYDRSLAWMDQVRLDGDMYLARKAFYELEKVSFYRRNYRNTARLLAEAREAGISDIEIRLASNKLEYREAAWTKRILSDLLESMPSRFWQRFYTTDIENDDFTAIIRIKDASTSPERQYVNRHTDTKKIKDGWEYVKKANGEIKTDSLGNKLKRDVYRNIRAHITEVFREKSGFIRSQLIIKDSRTGEQVINEKLFTESKFEDVAVRFRGDRRAICANDIGRLKDVSLPFPSDPEILASATELLSGQLEDILSDINL